MRVSSLAQKLTGGSLRKPRAIETNESRAGDFADLAELSLILVSPNVSEQMGGEAIKALQIYQELARRGAHVHQITHERVKSELERNFQGMKVSYVADTWLQKTAYRVALLHPLLSVISSPIISMIFQWRAAQLVKALLKERPGTIVHFTSPVSPVLPYFRVSGGPVIIGPINGNIHYPPAFRDRETVTYRFQRRLHPVLQLLNRLTFSGKRRADALLVAGGERTRRSLLMAGCRKEQLIDSIDSGVLDHLNELPLIRHSGRNLRFVHNGRLVRHKGADLIIRALKRTKNPVELDIIGRGPELLNLTALTATLSLQDRVKFVEWIADHSEVPERLRQYRAFVFPSLAEANGIVVQEAMVLGLPVIAVNWGGPSLLVTPETGLLIDPISEEHVIDELAKAMDRLAVDGSLADRMSVAGRHCAIERGFLWSTIISRWATIYKRLVTARACAESEITRPTPTPSGKAAHG